MQRFCRTGPVFSSSGCACPSALRHGAISACGVAKPALRTGRIMHAVGLYHARVFGLCQAIGLSAKGKPAWVDCLFHDAAPGFKGFPARRRQTGPHCPPGARARLDGACRDGFDGLAADLPGGFSGGRGGSAVGGVTAQNPLRNGIRHAQNFRLFTPAGVAKPSPLSAPRREAAGVLAKKQWPPLKKSFGRGG